MSKRKYYKVTIKSWETNYSNCNSLSQIIQLQLSKICMFNFTFSNSYKQVVYAKSLFIEIARRRSFFFLFRKKFSLKLRLISNARVTSIDWNIERKLDKEKVQQRNWMIKKSISDVRQKQSSSRFRLKPNWLMPKLWLTWNRTKC